jgi:two-component system chemotaxis response regulator CheY
MAERILIVDDSQVARQEIVGPLKSAGFDTIEAENGKAAVDLAKIQAPALIVTDVHMPIMNGIEMCEALFAQLGGNMPPVLVVSTESNPEMKNRGKAAGVKGWIIKPVDTAKLVQVAGMLIQRTKGAAA